MDKGIGSEVFCRECKQSPGRSKATAMSGVIGKPVMFLKMNESPGKLDESLVETAIGVATLEPELLQHIVCLVVIAAVKAEEKGSVLYR